jgi:mannosylglycerate hydrolase
MYNLHIVSHTHWDREWYLTFQQFRMKLVQLVDGLLALLETDPEYKHFMLDGQTIVLDDYLQIRPDRETTLRDYVQSGRLLIGPWHVLPDEFLVSPEATIRNLLQGARTARRFGPPMMIGYIPDPFGHIGQLPQILQGFGIETAIFRRGLSDEPCELWWQAPDGSRVLTIYLRDGYDNAAFLPTSDPENFVSEVSRLRDSLLPFTSTPNILLMQGTDHMEPRVDTAAALASVNGRLGNDILVHSTLPAYVNSVCAWLSDHNQLSVIPTVVGELRSPKRHHLLPGVLSSRMWIKQRNHYCEILLEKWAEPFSVWANLLSGDTNLNPDRFVTAKLLLLQTWRMLMECHPHDSICGCSVDQVHEEMRTRFDQVEQMAEEIILRSLQRLAKTINTQSPYSDSFAAVVVFNPNGGQIPGTVTIPIEMPPSNGEFEIVDQDGNQLPYQIIERGLVDVAHLRLKRDELHSAIALARGERINGMAIRRFSFRRRAETLFIDLNMSMTGESDSEAVQRGLEEIQKAMDDESLSVFDVRALTEEIVTVQFLASDVPGYGFRTFWVKPITGLQPGVSLVESSYAPIENEFFRVDVSPEDGTLEVTDNRTGSVFSGLNRFVDEGDCGDEYNFCPPEHDEQFSTEIFSVQTEQSPVQKSILVSFKLEIPAALRKDRKSRSSKRVSLTITTRASIYSGIPRVDISTEVHNQSRDHRLRVHFPIPFQVAFADYDGHFEVVRRPIGLPAHDDTWVERPVPQAPQRAFVDVSDGLTGLMIANRGLPEVEVIRLPDNKSEIALTLLRCVGWLSRDDFPTRRGHAGPAIQTPGAQMIGWHKFEYSIIPHAGGWKNAFNEAYAFNTPLRAITVPPKNRVSGLPSSKSLLEVTPETFVVSAVKVAEDGNGWIMRGYNISAETIEVSVTPLAPFIRVEKVNMAEEYQDSLSIDSGGCVRFHARPQEIITVKFVLVDSVPPPHSS